MKHVLEDITHKLLTNRCLTIMVAICLTQSCTFCGETTKDKSVQDLVESIKNDEWDLRNKSSRELVSRNAIEAIPSMIELLEIDEVNLHVVWVFHCLLNSDFNRNRASGAMKPAIPKLMALMNNNTFRSRGIVCDILGTLQYKQGSAEIAALLHDLNILKDHNDLLYVCRSLERLNAREAIPFLLEILKSGACSPNNHLISKMLCNWEAKEATPFIIQLLSGKHNYYEKTAALDFLIKMNVTMAIEDVIPLLKCDDVNLKLAALKCISYIGNKNKSVHLINMLGDNHPAVVILAIRILKRFKDERAIASLKNLLLSENTFVQEAAVDALESLQSTNVFSTLDKFLKDANPKLRASTCSTLATRKIAGIGTKLLPLINDKDAFVQDAAIRAIERLNARELIPALLTLADSQELYIKRGALEALGLLRAKESIPLLMKLCHDAPTQGTAYLALSAFSDDPAIHGHIRNNSHFLLEILRRDDCVEQAAACSVLAKIHCQEAVPELTRLLNHSDMILKKYAIYALNTLGTNRISTSKRLEIIEDGMNDSSVCLAVAVGAINQDESYHALCSNIKNNIRKIDYAALMFVDDERDRRSAMEIVCRAALAFNYHYDEIYYELLQDRDRVIREEAIDMLMFKYKAKIIPRVKLLLRDENEFTRLCACKALYRHRKNEAIPLLAERILDVNLEIAVLAAETLGGLGEKDCFREMANLVLPDTEKAFKIRVAKVFAAGKYQEGTKTLISFLNKDKDTNVTISVLMALTTLKTVKDALPEIVNLLKHENNQVRAAACNTLGNIPEALLEISALLTLIPDDDESVRISLCVALSKLQRIKAMPILSKILSTEKRERVIIEIKKVMDTFGPHVEEKNFDF